MRKNRSFGSKITKPIQSQSQNPTNAPKERKEKEDAGNFFVALGYRKGCFFRWI
jgi:hypothetical protein